MMNGKAMMTWGEEVPEGLMVQAQGESSAGLVPALTVVAWLLISLLVLARG